MGDEVTKDEPLTTNPNVGGFGQAHLENPAFFWAGSKNLESRNLKPESRSWVQWDRIYRSFFLLRLMSSNQNFNRQLIASMFDLNCGVDAGEVMFFRAEHKKGTYERCESASNLRHLVLILLLVGVSEGLDLLHVMRHNSLLQL